MNILELIIPDFLTIALGWLLLNKLRFAPSVFVGAEQLVYFVLFPAVLFHALTQRPMLLSETYLLAAAVAVVVLVGALAAWLARPALRPDGRDHASTVQCAYRFNTYMGLSLAASLGGTEGAATMAVLVGFGVPLVNTAAVYSLARSQQGGVLRELLRNPLILATVAGLAFNLGDIPIPAPVDATLQRLGGGALAIGLLCAGATLSLQGARRSTSLIAWMVAVRLLLLPAAALLLGRLLDLPALDRQMLLLFCALPTASSAHVLASRMGGNGRLVVVTMSISTLFSAATIPLWLLLGERWG